MFTKNTEVMRHLYQRLAHMAETTLTIFKMLTMLTIQREGLAAEPSSSTHGRDDVDLIQRVDNVDDDDNVLTMLTMC